MSYLGLKVFEILNYSHHILLLKLFCEAAVGGGSTKEHPLHENKDFRLTTICEKDRKDLF